MQSTGDVNAMPSKPLLLPLPFAGLRGVRNRNDDVVAVHDDGRVGGRGAVADVAGAPRAGGGAVSSVWALAAVCRAPRGVPATAMGDVSMDSAASAGSDVDDVALQQRFTAWMRLAVSASDTVTAALSSSAPWLLEGDVSVRERALGRPWEGAMFMRTWSE